MSATDLIQINLFSPPILCFALGILATLVRSDLKIPEPLYQALSIYLLLAIGFKGGVAIVSEPVSGVVPVLTAAILLCAATPLWCYPLLRLVFRFDQPNAAALAAHYGSVSVVTYLAAIGFLQVLEEPYEGFLPALVAVMEVPGILVALILVQRRTAQGTSRGWFSPLRSVLVGKSIFLLIGGLLVGALSGEAGMAKVSGFFVTPFQGVLCIFLLEMGMVAARRFPELRKVGLSLVIFALVIPLFHAMIGIYMGQLLGLSKGGAFVFGTLAASASYIAAPATIRLAIPQANPSYYLTSALAITFPFNLTLGIPLYFAVAGWLYS